MPDAPGSCDPHLDIVGFQYPLLHFTTALKSRRKVKVVAIGSSSTAGEGTVVPYPGRLETALRLRMSLPFGGSLLVVARRPAA